MTSVGVHAAWSNAEPCHYYEPEVGPVPNVQWD
jgi:hypothetical protein